MTAAPDNEPPRTRWWRVSNPGRPGDRLVFAALTAFRGAIAAQRFELHPHARERMVERCITREELLAAVRDGRIISHSEVRAREEVCGGYLAGELMVVVGALCPRGVDFRALTPTVKTLYRTEPLDPAQPLTMPIRELASLEAV
ncbi:MAG TPA: DUF4258 domain-containing protein [Steroidobacteraceae bacterium]|nr:DUF4258 domain-containing protein [Steroidobacteraceae bacterium]